MDEEFAFSDSFDVERSIQKAKLKLMEFRLIVKTTEDERTTIINSYDTGANIVYDKKTESYTREFMRFVNYNDKERRVYAAIKEVRNNIGHREGEFIYRMYYHGIGKARLKKMFKFNNNIEFEAMFRAAHYYFSIFYGCAVPKG